MTIQETIQKFIDKNPNLPFDAMYITGSTLDVYYGSKTEDEVVDLDVIIIYDGYTPFDKEDLGRHLDLIRSHLIHIPNDFYKRAKKLFKYNGITIYYISLTDWACSLAIHGSHSNQKYFNKLKTLLDDNKVDYKDLQKLVKKMSKDPVIPLREHIFDKGRKEFWKEFPLPEDLND